MRSLAPFRARFAADFAKTSFCENHNHRGNPRVDASVDAGVEQKMRDTGTADTRSAQGHWRLAVDTDALSDTTGCRDVFVYFSWLCAACLVALL